MLTQGPVSKTVLFTKSGAEVPGFLDFVSDREKVGHGTQWRAATLLWSPWEAGGDTGPESVSTMSWIWT